MRDGAGVPDPPPLRKGVLQMKKFLSLFLCLILLFALLPLSAPARADSSGDWEYYVYSDYTRISKYTGAGGKVTIPSTLGGKPVKEIGYYAFQDCSGLTSVTIPGSVTSIDSCAFQDCTGLTSVTIPDSVTSIGWRTFSGCSSLTSVTIPDSVTSIDGDAFSDCSGLTTVTIPSSVTSIGYSAFQNCSGLTSVTIPNSVTSIGSWAFSGCDGIKRVDISDLSAWCSIQFENESANPLANAHVLYVNGKPITKLTVPSGLTELGSYTFSGCSTLQSAVIPEGVKSIGKGAFYNCSALTEISVPDSVTSIGNLCFWKCGALEEFTIPPGVSSIGESTFAFCVALKGTINIPVGVTSIGKYAFRDCKGLTGVTIPKGVTSIGDLAFEGCSGLTSVSIPSGVTSIGYRAFSDCYGLTSLTIPKSVTNIGKEGAFGDNSMLSAGPVGSVCDIQYGWTDSIPDNTFSNCQSLRAVVIPGTVSEIRDNAFYNCKNLQHVFYGGTAEQWEGIFLFGGNDPLIGAEIHYGFKNGDPVILASGSCGDGVTWTLDHTGKLKISGSGAMTRDDASLDYDTRKLVRTMVISNGITSIDSSALHSCNNLTAVTIPKSVTKIDYAAFSDCSALTEVYYGGSSSDWKKISTGNSNDPLTSANITYYYTGQIAISGVKADKTIASTGESITWTATASGGNGTLQYCFFLYKDGTKIKTRSYSTAKTFSYTPTEAGSYKVKVYVKDTDETKVYKTGGTVTVTAASSALVISSIKAGVTSATTGEPITWTATASGGTGTLQYYFIVYKDGTKVKTRAYSTANTFSYIPAEPGTYKVKVYVKDAADTKVNKTSTGVTVTAAATTPTISSVKAGATSAYAGEKITWTATASGGTGTLQYYFILYKDGTKVKTRAYSTVNTFSYTPLEAGTYKVKVYVKDTVGNKVNKTSTAVTVTLGPPAIISVKAGKTSSAVGEKITWTATAVGSEQPLKYYFILYKDGVKIKTRSYSTTNTFSYTPTEAGTYKVRVYVKGAGDAKVNKLSAAVTVTG